jgi:uncharacterized protein
MKIKMILSEEIIFEQVDLANTVWQRLIGLMFVSKPRTNGILLDPCNSIHTFFMKYPIDVIFLNRSNEVVKIIKNIKPWRMTSIVFRAQKVLEFPVGILPEKIKVGDKFEVRNV